MFTINKTQSNLKHIQTAVLRQRRQSDLTVSRRVRSDLTVSTRVHSELTLRVTCEQLIELEMNISFIVP